MEIRLWRINEILCLREFSATTLFQETFYGSILICRTCFNLIPEKAPWRRSLKRSGHDHVSLSFKKKSNIKIAPWKGIYHSQGFWILGRGFRLPVFVSGIWILDSLSCISDSKAQDPGFREQKFPPVPVTGFPFIVVSGTYLGQGPGGGLPYEIDGDARRKFWI